MELIPILSTIILVATISTFLLAIGAYILYKVRERKYQRQIETQTSKYQAEVIMPTETQSPYVTPMPQPVFAEQRVTYTPDEVKRTPQPAPAAFTPPPKEYSPSSVKADEPPKKKLTDETKFMKYTSEGYITPQEDRSSGAVKWK
ncbi:Hypothetical protein IALB_2028 [Ignavibacterium album JCM 16511]|uniref:Uncharacterized protein n=1 Tax=Ignavibacterium album (strain DSM 19864 / JCM 16511 / NBRC 101810 / Mat9-16) TaxID=945713 RepID=I0AL76_IGNAJ|nr:hypothetical protein [Ignavibacterium album]AFH49733.1 Hypothetical protein IALB_2028 [Ignavibacterium album JCM 16511]